MYCYLIVFKCRYRNTFFFFFFLNDPAPPDIYPLPLHDPLPIFPRAAQERAARRAARQHRTRLRGGEPPVQRRACLATARRRHEGALVEPRGRAVPGRGRDRVRSEEHTSELQSPCNLVCRLLLEK